jgi:hypothetical protein
MDTNHHFRYESTPLEELVFHRVLSYLQSGNVQKQEQLLSDRGNGKVMNTFLGKPKETSCNSILS